MHTRQVDEHGGRPPANGHRFPVLSDAIGPALVVLALQRSAGNAAMARELSRRGRPNRVDARGLIVLTRGSGRRAAGGTSIRTSSSTIWLSRSTTISEIHGDQGTQHFVKIDGRAAAAALENLTVTQGKAVEVRWNQRDHRDLRRLIKGEYKTARFSSGSPDRLIGLLDGTRVEPVTDPWGESDQQGAERREVEKRALSLDAAELYGAFR